MPTTIDITTTTDLDYDEAVERTTELLADEGFGVLCDLSVHEILKEKIGVDRQPYRILGACNPPLADEAIGAVPEIGLLLPCNVVVRQDGDAVKVSAVRPTQMLSILPKDLELERIALDVEQRLERVIAAL